MAKTSGDEARLRLSMSAARKAMAEGKSPREAADAIRQMLADQHSIDTARAQISPASSEEQSQMATAKKAASPDA